MPVLVVAAILLGTGAEILPTDAIVGIGPFQLNLARILILVAFGCLLYTEAGNRRELFHTRLELPLLLLLGVALVTTLKWDTDARFRFLVESVALFYLAFALVRARPELRTALAFVAFAAVGVAALTGIAQVAQHDPTGFYREGCKPVEAIGPDVPDGTITRAIGTFLNPNLLAGLILLLAPLGALAVTATRKPEVRLVAGFGVALAYLALVFTFSRSGVVVALLALGAAVLTTGTRNKALLATIGVVLAAGALLLLGACGAEGAASGYGRGQEWRETIEVVKDNPVYGVGLGRVGDALEARDPRASAPHAHNLLLNWWAEAGPGALLAWAWILLALLGWSLAGALRGDRVLRATLVALVGFVGFSMTDHPANVDRVATAFWLVAALTAAAAPTLPLRKWPRAVLEWRRTRNPPPGPS